MNEFLKKHLTTIITVTIVASWVVWGLLILSYARF